VTVAYVDYDQGGFVAHQSTDAGESFGPTQLLSSYPMAEMLCHENEATAAWHDYDYDIQAFVLRASTLTPAGWGPISTLAVFPWPVFSFGPPQLARHGDYVSTDVAGLPR